MRMPAGAAMADDAADESSDHAPGSYKLIRTGAES
jgi:hypothetical protein